jgi:nitrogen fixation/metabolism regulation signal transduction histidine kinase
LAVSALATILRRRGRGRRAVARCCLAATIWCAFACARAIKVNIGAKVFEPKFTTKTSGMGLGLPMIKNIVETYNGSITFVSEEFVGSTFKVSFPKQ